MKKAYNLDDENTVWRILALMLFICPLASHLPFLFELHTFIRLSGPELP